jgi:transcriptional regulator with XRE-family HTH domain
MRWPTEANEFAACVGRNVRYLRVERAKLTQAQLAGRVGISSSQLSRIEAGERDLALRDAAVLAQELNVPITDLYLREAKPSRDMRSVA